jgi:diguanylate cyclase (GGDEF)-like protein/PAS domain S-box-containing protein
VYHHGRVSALLKILIAEGSVDQAESLAAVLKRGGQSPEVRRVETDEDLLQALRHETWDAVLIHSTSPHPLLKDTVRYLGERELDLAVVALTPDGGAADAVSAIKAGANHCLSQGDLGRLCEVLEGELKDAEKRRSQRLAERAAQEAEDRYRSLIEEIPALTYVAWADGQRSPVYVSPQVKAMTGFTTAEWLAEPESWANQIHPEDRERVLAHHRRSVESGEPFVCEYRALTRDGRVVWWRDEGRLLPDGGGRNRFLRGLVVDVTDRKQAEEAMRRLTYRDILTGLPNRALLIERLQEALETSRREGWPLALLLIDLDRFREINNTLGQHNGDLVIQEVAARLGDVLGGPERAARLRGDEFALILPDADGTLARQVAGKVLKALEQPIMVERLPIEVGASIGIALAPTHGAEPEVLLRKADLAMQAAKKKSAGSLLYTSECDPYNPDGLLLLGELRRALEAEQLALHYQPKIDLKKGWVIGAEALVRWRHPRRGLIPPDQFISLAEQGGLIKPLTRWVLGEAMGQCARWRGEGTRLPVAVNLSARNLHDAQLVEEVGDILDRRSLGPEFLELEITENAVMADPPRAAETLRGLQARGVGLSIDDFGTGYSSLVYLRSLPVSELKIDKSFVLGMAAQEEEDTIIVRSTTDLGHHLGLKVVAEGVEDQRTFDLLGSFGCDAAQGFFMGRPMPPADLTRWLKDSPWHLGH